MTNLPEWFVCLLVATQTAVGFWTGWYIRGNLSQRFIDAGVRLELRNRARCAQQAAYDAYKAQAAAIVVKP